MTREEMEQVIVGKRVTSVRWNDDPLFRTPAEPNQVYGITLDDGTFIRFEASGQIDVDRVWLHVEKE